MTPERTTTPEATEAAQRLADAADAEQQALARWGQAHRALCAAEATAAGNPTYRHAARLVDDTYTPAPWLPADTRARLGRLADTERHARADRDRAGRATVAARQAHHAAQQRALVDWLNEG